MAKGKQNGQNGNGFAQFEMDNKTKYGPIRGRSCTDILGLLIFIIFFAVLVGGLIHVLRYVDVKRSFLPSDTHGEICGEGKLANKKYLAFFNIFRCADVETSIIDGCATTMVCVEHCSNITFSINTNNNPKRIRERQFEHRICWNNSEVTLENFYEKVDKGECARFYFNSEPILNRCIPSVIQIMNIKSHAVLDQLTQGALSDQENNSTVTSSTLMNTNNQLAILLRAVSFGAKVYQDLTKTGIWIAKGVVVAIIVAFIWIFLMQWFARYLVWLSILALFVGNCLGLYFSVLQYQEYSRPQSAPNVSSLAMSMMISRSFDQPATGVRPAYYFRSATLSEGNDDDALLEFDFKGMLQDQVKTIFQNATVWLVSCIILGVLLLIVMLMMLCLCRRISLAVAVIEEAATAVNCMKSTLFFPIFPYIFKIVAFGLFLISFIIISAASHAQYRDKDYNTCVPSEFDPNHAYHIKTAEVVSYDANQSDCKLTRLYSRSAIYGAHAYNLFGLIWLLFFIFGVGYVTLAGAFASYYWTRDKKDVPFFALLGSFSRCVFYHLGSVAYGSLLVSVVRFIRIVIEYIENKCKKYADNFIAHSVICLCRCCFWCLEKFLKFVSKNAYIMIAIYGKGFCASAKDAFLLITENVVRASVLNFLSAFLIFISKISVTLIVGFLGYFVLTNELPFLVVFEDLNFYWVSLGIYVLLSYLVVSTFFNVYNIAIDTIFLCYLEDCKINNGQDRPFFMTRNLARVFSTYNRA